MTDFKQENLITHSQDVLVPAEARIVAWFSGSRETNGQLCICSGEEWRL